MDDTLHHRLLTLDSHADIPWPDSGDAFGPSSRCLDIPKMRAGGLKSVCLVAYIPQGPLTQEGFAAATARALAMLDVIRATGQHEGARLATAVAQIEAAAAENLPAIIPVVENGHAIGIELANIDQFRALGVRYITLTHNGHNALADSAVPRRDLGDAPALHGGLSDLGRAAITEMNRCGIVIDVSHTSRNTMLEAVKLSTRPVVASHSNVRALCDHPRNLDDLQLGALAANGGVIQLTCVPFFLRRGGSVQDTHITHLCDHIDFAVRRIGIDHVGIGTDFDGGGELSDLRDASHCPAITRELIRRGYGEEDIAKIWGGNFLRVLRASEG